MAMAMRLQQNLKKTRILPLRLWPEVRPAAHSWISDAKEPGGWV
jgi:hypothetical protein